MTSFGASRAVCLTDALEHAPGTSRLRHALAVRGRRYLEQLSRIPGAPVDLRLETAAGYAKAGAILADNNDANVGDPVAGRAAVMRAERELRTLMRARPERDDIRNDLARTLIVEAAVGATSFNENARALRRLDQADSLFAGVAIRSPALAETG